MARNWPRVLSGANDVDEAPKTVGRLTSDDILLNIKAANQRVETAKDELNKAFNSLYESKAQLVRYLDASNAGVVCQIEPHPDEPAFLHLRSADE